MSEQLELFGRRRPKGTDREIDWDAVSGIDLASDPRLLARWIKSPQRRREDAEMRRWAREKKRRPIVGSEPAGVDFCGP